MSTQDNISKIQMLNHVGHNSAVHASWQGEGTVTSGMIGPHDKYSFTRWDGRAPQDSQRNPTLFDVHHAPPHIHSLMSDKANPGHVAAHLGVAAVYSLHRWGELPDTRPEELSLSEHSAPILNRVNKALGNQYPQAKNDNSVSKEEGSEYAQNIAGAVYQAQHSKIHSKSVSPVSDSDIKVGLSAVKSLFSSQKLNKAQFHQPELPNG